MFGIFDKNELEYDMGLAVLVYRTIMWVFIDGSPW